MRSCLHCELPVPATRADSYCCFGCRVVHGVVRPAGDESGPMPMLRVQLFAGLFMALNVMALSFAFYGPIPPTGAWANVSQLFEYLLLFFATIVLATLGLPMFLDALQENVGAFGWLNARTLISVGVFAAFGLSAWHTMRGEGPIYYDSVTLILVAVTLGKHLEARAKRRAVDALGSALDRVADRFEIVRDGRRMDVERGELQVGDHVMVRAGQAIPVDGVVDHGSAFIDARDITGEPHLISAGIDDRVLAGSIAVDGSIRVLAEQVDEERLLARVDRTLREALASRFPAVRFADRIARVMAPVVIAIAVGATVEGGLMRGLSVLLIACPCALAVGPGLIVATAIRRAAKRGILFSGPETLERAATISSLFLDKTGTLTRGESIVSGIHAFAGTREQDALQILASIEAHSDHPVAVGLQRYAAEQGVAPGEVDQVRLQPGIGIEATIDGRRYRVGGAKLLSRPTGDDSKIYLLHDDVLIAEISIDDPERPEAETTIHQIQQLGVTVSGLSGDASTRAQAIAHRLNIPIRDSLLPEDKVEAIRANGGVTAMVGDGLNDAAALAVADVGFAVASASDLSKRAGDVTLLRDDLTLVPAAIEIAQDARHRLRRCLGWAIGYNAIGVALAAAGQLHPAFAASAMGVSSLLVIGYAGGRSDDEDETIVHAQPAEALP